MKRDLNYTQPQKTNTMKGYMYILECCDGSYYTGSTKNLERRLAQHQAGEGAKHTKKRLPVKLVYFEEYSRIDEAFYREKQVQGWSRKKKEALINGRPELLPNLAMAYRDLRALEGGISGASMPFVPEVPEFKLPEAPEGSGIPLEGGISGISMPFVPEATEFKLPDAQEFKLPEAPEFKLPEVPEFKLPEAPEGSGIPLEGGISGTSMPFVPDAQEFKLPEATEFKLPEAPEGSGISLEGGISGTSMPFVPDAHEFKLPEAPEFKLPEAPEFKLPEAPEFKLPEAPEFKLPEAPEGSGILSEPNNTEKL
jgi:putative endonuclease